MAFELEIWTALEKNARKELNKKAVNINDYHL